MKKITPSNLSKRLTQYSALSLAISGMSVASGQVIYHELSPTHDNEMDYLLNLNPEDAITPDTVEDNIDDFRIIRTGTVLSSGGVNIEILPEVSSEGGGLRIIGKSDVFVYPNALPSSYTISAGNINWRNTQKQALAYVSCLYGDSQWCGETDKFIGLEFKIGNSNTHYGWVKLDVSASGWEWEVKSFAFEATPGASIVTGDMGLNTPKNNFANMKIINASNAISIYNAPNETTYVIYDLLGKELSMGKSFKKDFEISTNTLSTGAYILKFEDNINGATLVKKVIIR